ncbi:ProQ/FINO family protein [Salmonella enterica]
MAAGKQKNTPVIVMKKKRHIISPPPTEEHVITSPLPELPSGTVENKMPAHQAKKNKKWTPEFINTSLEKVKALFPLLRAEEGSFRPLKIGITRDVTDFITQNPDAGLTLPEWQCAARIITRRWKYLERISVPGTIRYGIDGLPAGVVSEHEARQPAPFRHLGWPVKNKRDERER